ncbi:Predicted protein [Wolbachia endosymbiont strain TRS of Brugia malayi]|nr:Predicted protein [Wolbachia endosymbiont strain TRS of Brugia malayi]
MQNSGQQKFAELEGNRKVLSKRVLRKVEITTVSKGQNNSAASEKNFLRQRANLSKLKKELSKLLVLMIRLKLYRIDKMICERNLINLSNIVNYLCL